jgi:hypothetical protein
MREGYNNSNVPVLISVNLKAHQNPRDTHQQCLLEANEELGISAWPPPAFSIFFCRPVETGL